MNCLLWKENLLAAVFPREQYQMQYRFPSGDIADAVLRDAAWQAHLPVVRTRSQIEQPGRRRATLAACGRRRSTARS